MFAVGSRARLIAGLLGIFGAVVAFYALVAWLFPKGAVAACVALVGCIVVYFLYHWQIKPPVYDQQLREIRALVVLSPLIQDTFLPFSTSWTMESDVLLEILNYIQTSDCEEIVECGSGVSTVVIGNLLKQRKRGHLYSLEDDEQWCGFLAQLIASQGLDKYVTLVHAPLQRCPDIDADVMWYATDKAKSVLQTVKCIDLVIVDGPKSVYDLSRVPALPFFMPWMDAHTLLVLDDANRSKEQAVLAKWQQDYDIEIDVHSQTSHGQAYVRLRHSR